MKKQKKNKKEDDFKIKRMTVQRRRAISKIRKRIIKQANKKLEEEMQKYSNQSEQPSEESSARSVKRVIIDENSNQEFDYQQWKMLQISYAISQKSDQSRHSQQQNLPDNKQPAKRRTRSTSRASKDQA